MAKAGSEIPLRTHHSSGIADDKYNWELSIAPYTLSSAMVDTKSMAAELFKINVTVDWGDENSDGRKLELATLKMLTKNNNALP